jgi:biotin carboxyl carrier protein
MEENEIKPEYQWLTIDGVKYKTLLTKKYENRKKYEEVNDLLVYAFISGTINRIDVKSGKKVKTGDSLLILEAMKMNNVIRSACDGVVKKIQIKTGDHVTKGDLLIELV